MVPSDRGLQCSPGQLPKLLRKLPMFHDNTYDMSDAAGLTLLNSPRKSDISNSGDGNRIQSTDTPTKTKLLITPLSEYGRRTCYAIKEYIPLLDSCNMKCDDWARVAADIVANYDDFDAFIVLHGTDTMAYTASALSFMLENLSKTVILTGSQIPIARPRNDGVPNLLGALDIAGHFDIPEVSLFFGTKLFRGCRSSKMDCTSLNSAFDAPNCTVPLADVGISIRVNWRQVQYPPLKPLRLRPRFCQQVTVLRIYPGNFNTLENALAPPLEGLVLQTFGAGNAPDQDNHFLQVLKSACDRGLVVVNVSQCQRGRVESNAYATGTALTEAGVISGCDMTCEAALVKLGWLLARYPGNPTKVRKMMQQNLRGELSETVKLEDVLPDSSVKNYLHRERSLSPPPGKMHIHKLNAGKMMDALVDIFVDTQRDEPTSKSSAGRLFEGAHGISTSVSELELMNTFQHEILPKFMCSAAARGSTLELARIIATPTGGRENSTIDFLNIGNEDRRTPLHLAAAEGHLDTINFLLCLNESNPNSEDLDENKAVGQQKTPSRLSSDAKQYLKEKSEDPQNGILNVNALDRFGGSPMKAAIDGGHREVVLALKSAGAKLAGLSKLDLANCLCSICKSGDAARLSLYIEDAGAPCDPEVADYDGRTPLHVSAIEGHSECVQILLDAGADPTVKDRWGNTPLTEAKAGGSEEIFQMCRMKSKTCTE